MPRDGHRYEGRKIIVDAPLGYGRTRCIDCHSYGERRLPHRFPHICGACLFPEPETNERAPDSITRLLPKLSAIEELLQRNLGSVGIGNDDPRVRRSAPLR